MVLRIPKKLIAVSILVALVISVFVVVDRRPSVDVYARVRPGDGVDVDANGWIDRGNLSDLGPLFKLGSVKVSLEIVYTDGSKDLISDVFALGAVRYENKNVEHFQYQAWITNAVSMSIGSTTNLVVSGGDKTWTFPSLAGSLPEPRQGFLGLGNPETLIMDARLDAAQIERELPEGTYTFEWALTLGLRLLDEPADRGYDISYPVLSVTITPVVGGGIEYDIDPIRRNPIIDWPPV